MGKFTEIALDAVKKLDGESILRVDELSPMID